MKKVISGLFISAIAIATQACGKGGCDNARVCMVNNTNDTVEYAWNSNFYDQILLPGESACQDLGEMAWNESATTFFESDHGFYALDVDECEQTYYLD